MEPSSSDTHSWLPKLANLDQIVAGSTILLIILNWLLFFWQKRLDGWTFQEFRILEDFGGILLFQCCRVILFDCYIVLCEWSLSPIFGIFDLTLRSWITMAIELLLVFLWTLINRHWHTSLLHLGLLLLSKLFVMVVHDGYKDI